MLATQFFPIHAPDLEGLFDIDSIEALKEEFDKKVSTGLKLYTMGAPLKEVNRLMDLGIEEDKIPWGDE